MVPSSDAVLIPSPGGSSLMRSADPSPHTSHHHDHYAEPHYAHHYHPEEAKAESALKSFLAGGVGGALEVIVGQPLDLIKVRMQMASSRGTSIGGALRKTVGQEGVAGLFRGVSAPLAVVTPVFAVGFWAYDMGQRGIRRYYNYAPTRELTLTQLCVAGGFSALPTTLLVAPSERWKILMQVHKGRYASLGDCATQVYRQGGLRGMYRGTALTLCRDIPGNLAWFGTYEVCKLQLTKWANPHGDPEGKSTPAILTAGGLAGMVCWAVCIPFDVLKSRQQAAAHSISAGQVLGDLLRTEGWPALFRGLRPALLRAFPANAACFYGMEKTRDYLAFLDDY